MAAALPVTKLASLFIKTLAKPVSKRIKHEFSQYETTKRFLIFIGQTSHQITSRMTIWSAGYKVRKIQQLDEEKAMKTGSEFVGEFFILSVTATTVILEYNRSKEKENEKRRKQREIAKMERRDLQAKLHTLDIRLQALEDVVESNSQSILSALGAGGKRYEPPEPDQLVPITLDDDDLLDSDDDDEDDNSNKPAAANKANFWTTRRLNNRSSDDNKNSNNNGNNSSSKPWWKPW